MSVLKDKMLSYSPTFYYPMENAWGTNVLTNYGTVTTTNTWTVSTAKPFLSYGGPTGTGCWRYSTNSASEVYTRIFGNTAGSINPYQQMLDGDYSSGGWFRIPVTISGSVETNLSIIRISGGASSAQLFLLTTGTTVGKLQTNNPTTLTTTNRYDDGKWHYYAERMYFDGTNWIREKYLDGVLWTSGVVVNNSSLSYFEMADNFISNTTGTLEYLEFAHCYATTSAGITASDIASIWATGTGGFYNATKALPTQPEHWWPADENTSDLLLNYGSLGDNGNQNILNLSGSSPANYSWVNGEVEKAIYLNAFSGYDQQASWDVDSTFTINFWFKKDAPPVSAQTWMYWYLSSSTNIDSVDEAGILTNGYLRFKPAMSYSGGPYTQSAVETGMNVCDGNWHLITFTKNGATLKSYVDGQLKQTVSDWDPLANPNPAAGFNFGASNTYWDEFQLYDYTLSDAQILSLYQSEYPALAGYPLKYWNGSTWATPIAMKQWNGTAWVTMDGSVYNGSAWVDII